MLSWENKMREKQFISIRLIIVIFILLPSALALLSCGRNETTSMPEKNASPKDATVFTEKLYARLLKELPFSDKQDFEDAKRGLIAKPDTLIIRDKNGNIVWDLTPFSFIKENEPAPETVNPSLWRQSQLVAICGLFKVTERIYQVRTFDLSNMTIIEGDTGIIVVDPLISAETAKAALDFYYQHRPQKPIIAVMHSHSHVDHYGGVEGVASKEDVESGKVKIIAPINFLEKALTENVLAGNVMTRRASYMYGNLLPAGPKGQVGAGLGMTVSEGTVTIIPPTVTIEKTGQVMKLDGLTFEFLVAPDTEAPTEMHWYIPELRALTAAENACHTLHNVYTLRGAQIRDPLAWAKHLNETIKRWADKSDVLYGMHHWPVWGQERVLDHLKKQRDTYKYINDQTLRLANHGYTMTEIAEMIQLPKSLKENWSSRGYYGTINHDVKAAYVKYLGWFDGNPATLHPYPPVEASKRYVEFMGGPDNVIAKARKAYTKGDYRWVAEVVNHVVFAFPHNTEARALQADALEQLGYQAESGPWRNFYLSGAQELRKGVDKTAVASTSASPSAIEAMPLGMFFDLLGVRLNGPKAEGKKIVINWVFTDTNETYVLSLENAVLNHTDSIQAKNADATITLTRDALNKIILKESSFRKEGKAGNLKIEGSKLKVEELFLLMDQFDFWFNIVTPRK